MTWAEILAIFNFITWILPIIVRSYLAWRSPNVSANILSTQESLGISGAVAKLNLRGKKLNIGDGTKTDRDV